MGTFDLALRFTVYVFVVFLKPLVQLYAAVGADRGIGRDLLVAIGTIQTILVVVLLAGSLVLKAFVQLGATTGADRGIGRDLFVALWTVIAEFGPTLGTDGVVGIHLGPALRTDRLVLLFKLVQFCVVNPIRCHGSVLVSENSTLAVKEKGCHWKGQPGL
jgi:hypothetical protein